jgi:hypothetical protein
MALLPVALAGVLLACELHRRARPASLGRWRWLPLILLALPVQHLLRVILDRAGPGVPWWSQGTRGAYPSGATLAVALGWAVGVVVVGTCGHDGARPRSPPRHSSWASIWWRGWPRRSTGPPTSWAPTCSSAACCCWPPPRALSEPSAVSRGRRDGAG